MNYNYTHGEWSPEGWRPQTWKNGAPKGGRPEIPRFFSLSRHNFHSFFSWVFSWNFGGVLKRPDPQMFTFGVLGLSCETPAAPKPPDDSPRAKRAHFMDPGL